MILPPRSGFASIRRCHRAVADAARAGQQRNRQLRHHAHINDGAVAGFEPARQPNFNAPRKSLVVQVHGDVSQLLTDAKSENGPGAKKSVESDPTRW